MLVPSPGSQGGDVSVCLCVCVAVPKALPLWRQSRRHSPTALSRLCPLHTGERGSCWGGIRARALPPHGDAGLPGTTGVRGPCSVCPGLGGACGA